MKGVQMDYWFAEEVMHLLDGLFFVGLIWYIYVILIEHAKNKQYRLCMYYIYKRNQYRLNSKR